LQQKLKNNLENDQFILKNNFPRVIEQALDIGAMAA
jgi:hypothetical protein